MLNKLKYAIKVLDIYFLFMGVQPLVATISNCSVKVKKITIFNIIMMVMSIASVCSLVLINYSDLSIFKQQSKYGIANKAFITNQKLILFLVVIVIYEKITKIDQHVVLYRKTINFMLITFKVECSNLRAHYRKIQNLLLTNLLKVLYDLTGHLLCFVLHGISSSNLNNRGLLYNIFLPLYAYFPFFYINSIITMFICENRMYNFYLVNLNRVLDEKITNFNDSTTSTTTIRYRMECDELHYISVRAAHLHHKLNRTIQQRMHFIEFPILVFFIDTFFTLAFRPFYIYTMLMNAREEFEFIMLISSLYIILTKLFDTTLLMASCQHLLDNFSETGNILHKINPNRMDGALKDSIKLFSLQILQNPLCLKPFQLFTMNYGLWFMILSSSVAYFIILVQFQI